MSTIYIGNAKLNENGGITCGKPGDQKQTSLNDYKGEVSQQPFYIHKLGWNIIRPISVIHANAIANAMITACNNSNIGYDQGSTRLGIVKYGVNSKVKTGGDCGSTVRACIIGGTGKDPGEFYTGNELSVLVKSGLFEHVGEFISHSKTPIYNGDVLVTKKKGHTAIVTVGNPRPIKKISYYKKYTGNSCSIVDALKSVGESDTSKKHRKEIASANSITNYSGTSKQNGMLLDLLKQGKLVKA